MKIYKKAGDNINPDEPLFLVEANKKSSDIFPNGKGLIKEINVKVGDMVNVGQVVAILDGEIVEAKKDTKPSFDYLKGMMTPKKEEIKAKVTIIGSGPGGYVAAIKLAQLGADVVVVEKDKIGGTCLNRGCIPTKALVRSAEVYRNILEADNYGCFAENYGIDINKVVSRKDRIVSELGEGISYLLQKNNVKFITGNGEIINENQVFVKDKFKETTINTEYIIIATGSAVASLPIPGIESKNVFNSTSIMEINELPKELVVIGGGVIGMEFAFIFNSFGTKVWVVEYMDRVLPGLDEDISNEIMNIAENRGIKIYTGSKVEQILEDEKGKCIVNFSKNNESKHISTDKVLVSIGRQPYIEGLNVEKANIELNENRKSIRVNEEMRTNIPNIYAIGDVTGNIQLAHVASTQGIVAAMNIMGEKSIMDYTVVPSAIFTDPEIACVGIDEATALKHNLEIEVGKFPFASNGKALTLGSTEGFVKIIIDKTTRKVIGASIIGPNATDLINEISISIANGLTVDQITKTIHPHPTTSESVFEAALAANNCCIHN
ncbi:dihydrolipoamide dehydrogenase [Proteiniborus ethanoligenes]|uniref:Dihydrolipoyl dehydrogenase n=1 Tax=Proteiniborus ethanoligenes TaxID=415015 RepID=A0A1H3KV82_9FIRM|nr:dihydrolipoyl dehydrogenase [Proteiniborus ethanoligenes]TAH63372.1 MAG: dihydrolipoyl dehydrogenase [Gottschalkiaceae bacterium]SDY56113.1 dihydrolipoamide dehydrogenase [Proteiniborus ethanoligenes]